MFYHGGMKMNRVDEAFQHVDYDSFVLKEDGSLITQSTTSRAIKRDLELLDVQEGNQILEIGTGSGFSGALLSYLVGSSGFVESLDIEPDLTKRAKKMFKKMDINNVRFETKDGRLGEEKYAPYDRIIAWTTPDLLPKSWVEQLGENGYILSPFRILPLADSMVMVRFKIEGGILKGGEVTEGSYIPMTSEPVKKFFGHEVHADLVGEGEEPFWASSHWMKEIQSKEWKEKFLNAKPQKSPFQENGRDIRAYLLGKQPEGFTTAFHPDHGGWIGYSTPSGFALVSRHEDQWILSDENHTNILRKWWNDWHSLGKPSYEQLEALLIGNQVKVKLKND